MPGIDPTQNLVMSSCGISCRRVWRWAPYDGAATDAEIKKPDTLGVTYHVLGIKSVLNTFRIQAAR